MLEVSTIDVFLKKYLVLIKKNFEKNYMLVIVVRQFSPKPNRPRPKARGQQTLGGPKVSKGPSSPRESGWTHVWVGDCEIGVCVCLSDQRARSGQSDRSRSNWSGWRLRSYRQFEERFGMLTRRDRPSRSIGCATGASSMKAISGGRPGPPLLSTGFRQIVPWLGGDKIWLC